MKNLEEVMNAFARVLDKPRNPLYAMQELMEKLDAHGRVALQEYDEAVQHEQEYIILENENLELRQQLRMLGRVAS